MLVLMGSLLRFSTLLGFEKFGLCRGFFEEVGSDVDDLVSVTWCSSLPVHDQFMHLLELESFPPRGSVYKSNIPALQNLQWGICARQPERHGLFESNISCVT